MTGTMRSMPSSVHFIIVRSKSFALAIDEAMAIFCFGGVVAVVIFSSSSVADEREVCVIIALAECPLPSNSSTEWPGARRMTCIRWWDSALSSDTVIGLSIFNDWLCSGQGMSAAASLSGICGQ